MPEYRAKRDQNRSPTHPGELLREIIPATGRSKVEIATLLGISRQHLYDLLEERSRCLRRLPSGLASCSAMAPASGAACSPPMTLGMPNGSSRSRSARFRR